MAKKRKIIFWLIIAIIVVIVAALALSLWLKQKANYYAFYLTTGDIYFGRLSLFSRYTISDPHFLVFTQDEQNPVIIRRFQNAFWAPGEKLKFNPDNVIWFSKLDKQSPIIAYIESQSQQTGILPSSQPTTLPTTLPEVPPQATSTD